MALSLTSFVLLFCFVFCQFLWGLTDKTCKYSGCMWFFKGVHCNDLIFECVVRTLMIYSWQISSVQYNITNYGPDARKNWRQKEKGVAEDEMIGWHHWLNGHESEQAVGEWRTEEPGVLQSTGSQRVGFDFATEQQQNSSSKITVSWLCDLEQVPVSRCVCFPICHKRIIFFIVFCKVLTG